jgi:hypothetical protein
LLTFEQHRGDIGHMDAIVSVHSALRWPVLLAGLAALLAGLMGWLGTGPTDRPARQIMLIYAVALDLQVLLGIGIWVVEQRWAGGGRQFQYEHPIAMLLALVVAHFAAARARHSAHPTNAARVRTLGSGVSLLLILAAIPWQS